MTALWKRILVEKRAVLIPLVLGVVGNAAAYGLWVYPLGVKSAGAADRAAAAAQSLQVAERELAAAKDLVAGKSRAEQELATFFDKVLPADQAAARNLTYATLPALAKKTNVRMLDRRFEVAKPEKNARLGLLIPCGREPLNSLARTRWTILWERVRSPSVKPCPEARTPLRGCASPSLGFGGCRLVPHPPPQRHQRSNRLTLNRSCRLIRTTRARTKRCTFSGGNEIAPVR